MIDRLSLTRRPHVSQIGNSAGDDVPGIRLTVTETCTGQTQIELRASTPMRVPPRRVARKRILIPAAALLATLVMTANSAGASPIYWAPAKMARALAALQYPHVGTIGGTCKGIGKPRRGGYTGFRCTMTWQLTPTGGTTSSGKATAWARPLANGRVCGSTSSLAACRPLAAGPLPGDPRVCTLHPTDPDACTREAAELAIVKKVGPAQSDCTKVSTFVYRCTYGGPGSTTVYTVTFAKGTSGWTTTVEP